MDEGRLDYLERSLEDHRQNTREVVEAIRHLDQKIDARFGGVDTRFLGVDARFQSLETRFQGLETRFLGLETRFQGLETRFQGLETRVDSLDRKVDHLGIRMDSQFHWLVGLQFGTAVAVIGAIVGALFAVR